MPMMITVAETFRLMTIASQLSGLPMTDTIPFVFERTDKEIQEIFCIDVKYCNEVYAFTDITRGEIQISNNLGSYSWNTIMVHELTHWLEYKANVNQLKPCQDEETAYNVEVAYMLKYEHKPDPEPAVFHCP